MRILALGGTIGPLLFAVVVSLLALLRPGYSQISDFISELGATDTANAALMNYVGFIPTGFLLAAFGIALAKFLPRDRWFMATALLITLFGCGIAIAGLFSCDVGCPQASGSLENRIHDTIAPPTFLCGIIGIGLFGVRIRRYPAWQHLGLYSLLSSLVALGCFIALVNSLDARQFTGLWQRLMLFTLFLWCGVVGWRLWKTT